MARSDAEWGRQFDPDRVALIELRAWKAYYRRQRLRLFASYRSLHAALAQGR